MLNSADAAPAKANLAVDNTAALLDEDFPDVIAVRLRLAATILGGLYRQSDGIRDPGYTADKGGSSP